MPAKHSRKIYVENGYYHIYNRGVEKRIIFQDEQDYRVFLSYLKTALSPSPDGKFALQGQALKGILRQPKNFSKTIELVAFCLMPNHFHFLLKQLSAHVMNEFVQSLLTRYTMYFNKKYKRVGSLFQGRYKAITIETDPYLMHLSRYIHRNPLEIGLKLENAYSSYSAYLGNQGLPWLTPEPVLTFFQSKRLSFLKPINTYKAFVEQKDMNKTEIPDELLLELL